MWAGSSVCHRFSKSATEGEITASEGQVGWEAIFLSHLAASLISSL